MNIRLSGGASSSSISQNSSDLRSEQNTESPSNSNSISLQEFNAQRNQSQRETLDNAVSGSSNQTLSYGGNVDITGDRWIDENPDMHQDLQEISVTDNDAPPTPIVVTDNDAPIDPIVVSNTDVPSGPVVVSNNEAPSLSFQQIGQREGLDYYRGMEDDIRARFSNQNNTREYIEIDGDNADIDTGRGDDAAYLRGDNNRVEFGNGSDVGGTFGRNGRVFGEGGSDVLYGRGDHSAVYGGTGNDYVEVSGQSSVGYGDQGQDRIVTTGTGSYGFGGADDDTLVALGERGLVDGGEGNDKLIVAGVNNTASGGAGDDQIAMVTQGNANGGEGNDSILLKAAASGSRIDGGNGRDAVHVETARDGGEDWDVRPKENGSANEWTLTVGDSVYELNNIEDIHFADGRSVTYNGSQWEFTDTPAPEAPLTERPDFSWPERVPEGPLEPEQFISISVTE